MADKTPRRGLLEMFLGQNRGKEVRDELEQAADALDSAGIQRKELSEAEKGYMDSMRDGMRKMLGKYTDKADDMMADEIVRYVLERVMTAGEGEAVVEEVEDEYDTEMREIKEKQITLLDQLVNDQAALIEQQKAIGATVAALNDIPAVVTELAQRLIALEKQLTYRGRAASKAAETELNITPEMKDVLNKQINPVKSFFE